MKVTFKLNDKDSKNFVKACEVAITSIGASTKAGVTEAAQEIMMESMNQVPRDTGTLASSAFAGVSGRVDLKSRRYGAVLGYGAYEGVGSIAGLSDTTGIEWFWPPTNPRNPRNKMKASAYASRVHESLTTKHLTGGKAKFLEDPVREWSTGRFSKILVERWSTAIDALSMATVDTSLSNASIVSRIERGQIDASFPSKEGLFAEYPNYAQLPNKYSAREWIASRNKYYRALSGYQTAQHALKNPSSTKRRDRKNLRPVNMRYTKYTHTKTQETWRGNR